jgi:hypothetical protein
MHTLTKLIWFFIALLGARSIADGAPPALFEVTAGKDTYRGREIARDAETLWFQERDGSLERLKPADVTKFTEVGPRFTSYSAAELRDRLRRELGRDFEVLGTGHYLVCARKDQARQYAQLFENIYRSFYVYFSTRGFAITEPEFPMVAIVFPDQSSFARYAERDEIKAGRGLMGYYLMTSNRVAVFDSKKLHAELNDLNAWDDDRWLGATTGGLADTIIHETTHQVAFNTGIHSRIAQNPKWLCEGLATVFEAPGIRNSSLGRDVSTRINGERYTWFQQYRKRRPARSLEKFVSSDDMFSSATLDAYSQSWALTLFLLETRPREYAKLLKLIAARPPLAPYGPEERLQDFKQAFGNDLAMLESAMLRYIDKLSP